MFMTETLTLWHGSPRKIVGEYLLPMQAGDISGSPENNHDGIYAIDKREFAIVMAILKCKGTRCGSMLDLSATVPEGIIIEGWPVQKQVYLHRLAADTFRQVSGNQWVSFSRVKPLETEEIAVKEFMHLIRPAIDEEKHAFYRIASINARKRIKA